MANIHPVMLPIITLILAPMVSANAMTPPSLSVNVAPRSPIIGAARRTEQGLGAGLYYWQSRRDRRQSGRAGADNPFDEIIQSRRATVLLDFPILQRLSGVITAPFYMTAASFSGLELTADGPGDAVVLTRYTLFQDRLVQPHKEIFALLGFDLATGSTDIADAQGTRLPATLQPGSGTSDFISGLAAAWSLAKFSLFGDITYKRSSSRAYTFGDALGINAGAHFPLSYPKEIAVTLELNSQIFGKDTSHLAGSGVYPDQKVRDSGSETVFLTPGLQWNFNRGLVFLAGLQLPIYQNYRGTQLAAARDVVLGLSGSF